MFKIFLSDEASLFLRQLKTSSPKLHREVLAAVGYLQIAPAVGEPLQGKLSGFLKIRLDTVRMVYRLDKRNRTVFIRKIDWRETVYDL
jgi:mRNA-degrading endonuclease RelE of RelBE toxin-antitoxin system